MIKKNCWQMVLIVCMTGGLLVSSGCDTSSKEVLYIAGTTGQNPCYWKDGELVLLGFGDGTYYSNMNSDEGHGNSVFVSGQDAYVAGTMYCAYLEGKSFASYWKNGVQTVLTSSGWAGANSIFVCSGDVYMAGQSWSPFQPTTPCYWKNGIQTDLSMVEASLEGYANSIFVSGDDVYVAGYSRCVLGDIKKELYTPHCWKNGTRTDLSTADASTSGSASSVFVSGSDVYLAGMQWNSSIAGIPCYWKNGERIDLSVSPADRGGGATSLFVSDSDVYAAGYTWNSSSLAVPCYWKNGERIDLNLAEGASAGLAYSIYVSGSDVYVSGFYENRSFVSVPCYWKDGVRTDLTYRDHGYARSIFLAKQ